MRCTQFGSCKTGGGNVGKEKPVRNDVRNCMSIWYDIVHFLVLFPYEWYFSLNLCTATGGWDSNFFPWSGLCRLCTFAVPWGQTYPWSIQNPSILWLWPPNEGRSGWNHRRKSKPFINPNISQIICSTIRPLYLIWGSTLLMLKTKRQASMVRETMKALVAEARLRPTSSVASYKAASSKVLGGKDSKEEMKKVPFI